MNTDRPPYVDEALRQRAQDAIRRKRPKLPDPISDLSAEDSQRLLLELGVYQVELEMQNEQLRQAEAQAEASYRRYLDLYQQAPAGYCTLGEYGQIVQANQAAAALLGVSLPDLEKHLLCHFIWPPDVDQFNLYFHQVARSDPAQPPELRLRRHDGTPIWVHLSASRVPPAQDGATPSLMHIVLTDIDLRKQAEQVLRSNHEMLSTILETALDGFWRTDPDGRLLQVNASYCQQSGFTHDELLGMQIVDIDASNSPNATRQRIRSVICNGHGVFETRHRRRDGSIWEVEVNATYHALDGGQIYAFHRDITERKRSQALQVESEQRFRALTLLSSDWHWEQDADFRFVSLHSSPQQQQAHLAAAEYVGHRRWEVPALNLSEQDWDAHKALLQAHLPFHNLEILRADMTGQLRWITVSGTPIFDEHGGFTGYRGVGTDITERKLAEQKLHLAASVFTHAHEGILITASDGTILDVNQAFTHITGFTRDDVLGRKPNLLKSGRQTQAFYVNMWHSLLNEGHWYGELWNRRSDGEIFVAKQTISAVRDRSGAIARFVALFADITLIKEQQQQLEHRAHYDALTALPNRVLLADRMQQAMVQTLRHRRQLAVVYLDLDGFKAVNDSYGHQAGDQLLVAVSTRMRQVLREGDTLARLGGDEFVAVLLDLNANASVRMLDRLLAAAAQPVLFGSTELQVSASLGLTFYPQTIDVDADQLLRQADSAMYQAKQAGKNRCHVFDSARERQARGHHESLLRIRRALNQREFVLHYQPKINLRSGALIGVEALLRWQHPRWGLLLPDVFLPIFEDHALAVELGEWVIDSVLMQMRHWQADGLELAVSVNIGTRQLLQSNFVDRLRTLLAAHPKVPPTRFGLELQETSVLENMAQVSSVIRACHELGVNVALDDFGTGYSSLTYLRRLPFAQIKIDQRLARSAPDRPGDPGDLDILLGVIMLAGTFHRQLIAEGIESSARIALLLQLGCELGQGHGIARPMPASDLAGWVTGWQTRLALGTTPITPAA